MNPIESGTSSTAGFDGAAATTGGAAAAPATTAGVTTTSSAATNGVGTVATTSSTSPVSPELQAVKHSSQTTAAAANNDQFSLMSKVVDALVNVVTALVTLMTSLMSQFKGAPINGSNGPSGGTGSGNTGNTTPGNGTGGTGGTTPTPGANNNQNGTVVRSALDVNKNDAGMITVRTLDGYTIRAEGRDQAWTITGPDGKTTRIWGDPHVSESDGDKWDFLNRSTFMFGKNKVTVEVVPAGNGQTLSARITVYSDHERVTIDGIEKNQPSIVAASSDGLEHDASLADGDIYKRVMTPTGESWVSTTTGKPAPGTK
jgi:hypothetical protein